jgi:hypothetical protein
MSLSKFQLEIIEEALQLTETYMLYVKNQNPQLHEAANGTPSASAKVASATIIVSSQLELQRQ